MLNANLTGVELLDLGITCANSTISLSENDLTTKRLQDHKGNAFLCDEGNGLAK